MLVFCALYCAAQSSEAWPPVEEQKDDSDRPKSIRETLEKLRIDKEKKEFDSMLERSERAVLLADDLEKTLSGRSTFTKKDLEKIETLEKLVKKIRSDLGGQNDEENKYKSETGFPGNITDSIGTLKKSTVDLMEELRKSTRFTVSAAAIQSSNAVLRIARFLRIAN